MTAVALDPLIGLPPLGDLQWSLDSLVMGPDTRVNVSRFEFGSPDADTQDQRRPGEDGARYGRDRFGGRLVTLELNAWSDTTQPLSVQQEQAADALDVLEGAWSADAVRFTPGAYSILRWRRGAAVRRCYGRANPILADSRMDYLGNIPVTATFRTMDPWFYDDVEQRADVALVPTQTGGLVGPLIGPVVASGYGSGFRGITVGGTRPTWLVSVIRGPIQDPILEIVGRWSYQLRVTLGPNEWIMVDPTSWARAVRSDQDANRSGRLTAASQSVKAMKVPPGQHAVVLRGADITNTARAELYWRSCFSGYIGGR